jgi:signal transduction histidine kinase
LTTSIDDNDSDHRDTLLCIKSACRTAVEILNDLLCFDKLESGILVVHKHDVSVIPFIADCVDMFASQAREAGVTIKNITKHLELLPGIEVNIIDSSSTLAPPSTMTETDLLNEDIVFMDKFKMDQVLRNLISNAVKFTPRGGSVTVCAYFIPNQKIGDDCALIVLPAATASGSWASLSALRSCLTDIRYHFHWLLRSKSRVHVNENSIADDLEMGLNDLPQACPHDTGVKRSRGKNSATDTMQEGISCVVRNRHDGPGVSDITNSYVASDAIAATDIEVEPTQTIAGKLWIVVTDTGAGISEANQLRLFKEIVQFNPEVLQAGGGSGLGLWITSSIVQMHSGTIQAYSAGPNKGSTFTVEIDMHQRVLPTLPVEVFSHASSVQTTELGETRGAVMALDFQKLLLMLNMALIHATIHHAVTSRHTAHLDHYDLLDVDNCCFNRRCCARYYAHRDTLARKQSTVVRCRDGARIARGVGGVH